MNDMCWVQVGSCFSGSCCRLWPYFWCRAHQPIKSEIRGMGATEASDISIRSTCSGNPEEVPACQKSDKKNTIAAHANVTRWFQIKLDVEIGEYFQFEQFAVDF